MGLFKRKNLDVEVRVLQTGPMGTGSRLTGLGRTARNRELKLEIRCPDGTVHTVEKEMYVPQWVGVEQLVQSGRVLTGKAPSDDPSVVSVEWEQIEEDVSPEVFAQLFHKQGPPAERLALLEDLYAKGQFKDELYEKARRELLAEMS